MNTSSLVVVNLLQNDSWIIQQPHLPAYQYRWGNKKVTMEDVIQQYLNTLTKIKDIHPDTPILCMLGNMDITFRDEWSNALRQALLKYDPTIHFLKVPFKNTPDHPNRKAQQQIATLLSNYITEKRLLK